MTGDPAAGLLLDFAKAFPPLSRGFFFAVLRRIRFPAGLVALAEAMYRRVRSDISFGGAVLRELPIGAGICPLSGLLLALCLGPLIPCALSCQALSRSTLAVIRCWCCGTFVRACRWSWRCSAFGARAQTVKVRGRRGRR